LNIFNGSLDDLYKLAGVKTDPQPTTKKHTVAAGDTIESVANKYGLTVRELVSANPQLLKTGDQLTIPGAVVIPSEDENGSPPTPRTHTVKPGENLTVIAIKYGTTVAAIASANNITNINNISVGQVLIIP
ncbi:MAG TPA: LysM domain-containing protein, partial [Anaerolineales bacterium]|nr:LysM domain-containing protein [Anaerolineales bacterium]